MSDTDIMMRLSKELQKHPQTKEMVGREALILRCVKAAQGGQRDTKDAARYRWLRDSHIGDDPEAVNLDVSNKPGLDAAIDAAMGAGE